MSNSKTIGFIPLAKIDEQQQQVFGWAAEEKPDQHNQIMDYAATLPRLREWSERIAKISGGKSLGNVRAMHQNIAAGKLIVFEPHDDERRVWVGAEIVDPLEWQKVMSGVYNGFSIGGSYGRIWKDPKNARLTRYEGIPVELSLADNPDMYGSTFEMVLVAGAKELRKFAAPAQAPESNPEGGESPMENPLEKVSEDSVTPESIDLAALLAPLQELRNKAEAANQTDAVLYFNRAIELLGEAVKQLAPAQSSALGQAVAEAVVAIVSEELNAPEAAMSRAARVGDLRKVAGDVDGLRTALTPLATLPADLQKVAGDVAGLQTTIATLADLPTDLQKVTGDVAGLQTTIASLATLPTDLTKLAGDLAKVAARLVDLEAQPAEGGPVLRPAGKTLPTDQTPPPDPKPLPVKSLDELQKLAATEPNPVLRADYTRQLIIAEQATARRN